MSHDIKRVQAHIIYTTTPLNRIEVAKYLGVSPISVANWIRESDWKKPEALSEANRKAAQAAEKAAWEQARAAETNRLAQEAIEKALSKTSRA